MPAKAVAGAQGAIRIVKGRRERTSRRLGALLWVLPLVALFAWSWNSSPIRLKDRFFARHLSEVYPDFLYRSGQVAPNLIGSVLRDLKIDVVVDLTGELDDAWQDAEREAIRELGVRYVNFTLRGDGTGAVDQYVAAIETIARAADAKQRTLVHCRAGDRRTGGVIAAYELLVRGESREMAIRELARYSRSPIEQSRVFAYLNANLAEIARGLRARGVVLVEPAPDAVAD